LWVVVSCESVLKTPKYTAEKSEIRHQLHPI
jgi:hypothetical protein